MSLLPLWGTEPDRKDDNLPYHERVTSSSFRLSPTWIEYALGFLQSRTEPGRTRPRTHYELTEAGREALTAWLAEPAAMPRVQNESMIKLLAADFSDDATIAASLAGVRGGLERAYEELEGMEQRALKIPHRTRYLRMIDDYARRSLDAQREWLDAAQEELEQQK